MTLHWLLFVPGLLVLLYPTCWMLSSSVQLRNFESFQSLENSPRQRPWWWVTALWLDPIRGYAGMFLLTGGLGMVSQDWSLVPKDSYAILLGIVAISVLAQTLTWREEDTMLAPVGFVCGLVASLLPWEVSLIALAMAITGLFAFRRLHAFFSSGILAVGILGIVLESHAVWLTPALMALAIPVIAAFVTGRQLALPTRREFTPPPFPKVGSVG